MSIFFGLFISAVKYTQEKIVWLLGTNQSLANIKLIRRNALNETINNVKMMKLKELKELQEEIKKREETLLTCPMEIEFSEKFIDYDGWFDVCDEGMVYEGSEFKKHHEFIHGYRIKWVNGAEMSTTSV